MKVITGLGEPLYERMLILETRTMECRRLKAAREP